MVFHHHTGVGPIWGEVFYDMEDGKYLHPQVSPAAIASVAEGGTSNQAYSGPDPVRLYFYLPDEIGVTKGDVFRIGS